MVNLLLAFILSCASHSPLDYIAAKKLFQNKDCVSELRSHMEKSKCKQLRYTQTSEFDMMFRCHRPDADRGEFWDNYIFRVSPVFMQYSIDDMKLINEHTICIDKHTRVEAYPPHRINTEDKQ